MTYVHQVGQNRRPGRGRVAPPKAARTLPWMDRHLPFRRSSRISACESHIRSSSSPTNRDWSWILLLSVRPMKETYSRHPFNSIIILLTNNNVTNYMIQNIIPIICIGHRIIVLINYFFFFFLRKSIWTFEKNPYELENKT